jgi:hypothetical protein
MTPVSQAGTAFDVPDGNAVAVSFGPGDWKTFIREGRFTRVPSQPWLPPDRRPRDLVVLRLRSRGMKETAAEAETTSLLARAGLTSPSLYGVALLSNYQRWLVGVVLALVGRPSRLAIEVPTLGPVEHRRIAEARALDVVRNVPWVALVGSLAGGSLFLAEARWVIRRTDRGTFEPQPTLLALQPSPRTFANLAP